MASIDVNRNLEFTIVCGGEGSRPLQISRCKLSRLEAQRLADEIRAIAAGQTPKSMTGGMCAHFSVDAKAADNAGAGKRGGVVYLKR